MVITSGDPSTTGGTFGRARTLGGLGRRDEDQQQQKDE
jgi:hypothetical protein